MTTELEEQVFVGQQTEKKPLKKSAMKLNKTIQENKKHIINSKKITRDEQEKEKQKKGMKKVSPVTKKPIKKYLSSID